MWDYSFRQFGIVQSDAYIGGIAAVFDVLTMHDIGTHRAELGDDICPAVFHSLRQVVPSRQIT
nr:hypothetical protein [Enterobacter sp. S-16]